MGNLEHLVDLREPDVVYFNILRLYTVHYPPTWAIPLAMVVLGIFAGVLVYGLQRRLLSWSGIGYGIFVLLVSLILAALPSLFLEFLLGRWLPEVTADYDNRSVDQPFEMSAIVLISLALILLWYASARKIRETSLSDLTIGALTLMAAGMITTSIAFPALSYGFTWPLLFSLVACLSWFYWQTRQKNSNMIVPGLLVSEAASLVTLGPGILLGLFSQLSLALVFLGTLCGFLLPQMYIMLGYKLSGDK